MKHSRDIIGIIILPLLVAVGIVIGGYVVASGFNADLVARGLAIHDPVSGKLKKTKLWDDLYKEYNAK